MQRLYFRKYSLTWRKTIPQEESSKRLPKISCTSCQASIGYVDVQACGLRLHKWSLSSSSIPNPNPLVAPPISTIISAKLLSILRAQVSSKILLIPENSSLETLHLWVLQQSLFYSTSESATGSRIFAMKVLWKHASGEETKKLLANEAAEDISLPDDAVAEVEKCLRESARCLPPNARLFQGWNVGLLERYQDGQWKLSILLAFTSCLWSAGWVREFKLLSDPVLLNYF